MLGLDKLPPSGELIPHARARSRASLRALALARASIEANASPVRCGVKFCQVLCNDSTVAGRGAPVVTQYTRGQPQKTL